MQGFRSWGNGRNLYAKCGQSQNFSLDCNSMQGCWRVEHQSLYRSFGGRYERRMAWEYSLSLATFRSQIALQSFSRWSDCKNGNLGVTDPTHKWRLRPRKWTHKSVDLSAKICTYFVNLTRRLPACRGQRAGRGGRQRSLGRRHSRSLSSGMDQSAKSIDCCWSLPTRRSEV